MTRIPRLIPVSFLLFLCPIMLSTNTQAELYVCPQLDGSDLYTNRPEQPGCHPTTSSVPSSSTVSVDSLHKAAMTGDTDQIRTALNAGFDPNSEGGGGETLLHWAAAYGQDQVAELLLDSGADIQAATGGKTPLRCASEEGHLSTVRLLLARGAEINTEDDDGLTPLHVVAAKGHIEIVALLIARGANVSSSDDDGLTPLHLASALGQRPIVQLLLEKGANLNARTQEGLTPLAMAAANGQEGVVQLLKSKGALN